MNKRHYQYIVESVNEWLKQVTFNLYEEISDEGLLAGILNNFDTFLRQELKLGENTENELLYIKTKLNELLTLYSDPKKKRQILVHLYKADMPITYSFFKEHSIDKLFLLSEDLLAYEEQLRNNSKN